MKLKKQLLKHLETDLKALNLSDALEGRFGCLQGFAKDWGFGGSALGTSNPSVIMRVAKPQVPIHLMIGHALGEQVHRWALRHLPE